MELSPRIRHLVHSPIGAAHALLELRVNDQPLLDLSQAAPAYPPAPVVADRIAEAAHEPTSSRYAPQPGLPGLREAFAADLTEAYETPMTADEVLITGGCNQAFCVTVSALTDPGDSVILASPFYFNHDMWLQVEGVEARHLPAEEDHLPDPARAERLIDESTRAIVLVSPGNPTGVTIPPSRLAAFAELARRRGIALIVDETYRTFRPTSAPAHELFSDPEWHDTVISLHSFSKDLAIPGHRIGAVVSGSAVQVEALKILDCVAISASWIGQEACIAGLLHAGDWRAEQSARVADLQRHFESVMQGRPGGFELVASGAYFGWVRFNSDTDTATMLRRLVTETDILVIPGTAFTPDDEHFLRFSFANLIPAEIDELGVRLDAFDPAPDPEPT